MVKNTFLTKGKMGVKGEVSEVVVGIIIELYICVVYVHMHLCIVLPRSETTSACINCGKSK